MLQVQRMRRSFRIGDGFLFISLVNFVFFIEYKNAKHPNQLYRTKYPRQLPNHLLNYFSSTYHLYAYLTQNPHRIINATQKRIQLVVTSANHHSVAVLELQKAEKVANSDILRQIVIVHREQTQKNNLLRQRNAARNQELNNQLQKLLSDAKEKYDSTSIKLQSYQQTLKEKEEYLSRLQQSIKRKQQKIRELKKSQSSYLTIDD